MSRDYRQISDLAMGLSPDERVALAEQLIDSVEGPADPGWEEAWLVELERRRAQGLEAVAPWTEARRRVLSRLARRR